MSENDIVVVLNGRVYMSVKQASDYYGIGTHVIYDILKRMEQSKRYGRFLAINKNRKTLINSLMLEDWMSVSHLYDANLGKHAPALDLAEVRRARGEE